MKWSDLPAAKRDVWVEKIKISEVLGHAICITGFEIKKSRYAGRDNDDKEYIQIEFTLNGRRHFTNSGSMLIRKQLEACKDDLPLETVIVKKDNWYSLS